MLWIKIWRRECMQIISILRYKKNEWTEQKCFASWSCFFTCNFLSFNLSVTFSPIGMIWPFGEKKLRRRMFLKERKFVSVFVIGQTETWDDEPHNTGTYLWIHISAHRKEVRPLRLLSQSWVFQVVVKWAANIKSKTQCSLNFFNFWSYWAESDWLHNVWKRGRRETQSPSDDRHYENSVVTQ